MVNKQSWHDLNSPGDDAVFWGLVDNTSQPPVGLIESAAPRVMQHAAAQTDVLFLTETGDTSAISVDDIHQGGLGDCYLLSSFGEEALFHPAAISHMIHANANGTETVTLYLDSRGRLPTWGDTSFKAVAVTVTNVFANNAMDTGAGQDVLGNLKEIWPQVIEKAFAEENGGVHATMAAQYAAIGHGGNPALAMMELTGQTATYQSAASVTLAGLLADVAAGDLLVFDTGSSKPGYGLVANHAYMFDRINGSGASATVQLLNPWGVDQPAAIPIARLASSGIQEVDVGHPIPHS
jgi:hypothetical protein